MTGATAIGKPRLSRASIGAIILLCGLVMPAAGHSAKSRDRTDNTFAFTYDASNGEMPSAESSARFKVGDKVDYFIYIRERPGARPGERLSARLQLRLNDTRAVTYEGDFTMEISFPDRTATYSDSRSARIVLRPRKGERRASLRFDFDLPSGSYRALGRFSSG